jgi:tetratricopeptide (TPR) repeat protein
LLPTNWKYIKGKFRTDERLCEEIRKAEGATTVPSALLDFGLQPKGDDRPQEAFSGLKMLKRQLVSFDIHFPLYDFACVSYLSITKQLTPERLRNLFPPEEISFGMDIADCVTSGKVGTISKAVLNIFNKHNTSWRGWLTLYSLRRKLLDEEIEHIKNIDLESDLTDELPRLFAEDLNTALRIQSTARLALFFDTHEAFWGSQDKREMSNDLYFRRDEWLRKLIGTLDMQTGVVVAVAGREPPRWHEASRVTIPKRFVYHHHVRHMAVPDAVHFLERAGVDDPKMRRALAEYAQVKAKEVHPYFLGLCADIVIAAYERGEQLTPEEFKSVEQKTSKEAEIVNRLLRYLNLKTEYAVRALCACRSFGKEEYLMLGAKLDFETTEPSFEVLTRFSFVWRAKTEGEDRYRMHELLRRLLHGRNDEVMTNAHKILSEYYRSLGSNSASAESVYHQNQFDWKGGVQNWLFLFDTGQTMNSPDLCRALMGIRDELVVEGEYEQGLLAKSEAEFLWDNAQYTEAIQKLSEAIIHLRRVLKQTSYRHIVDQIGDSYVLLGQYQSYRAVFTEALNSLAVAVKYFDALIEASPTDLEAYAGKARALCAIAMTKEKLALYNESVANYSEAISLFNYMLDKTPHNFGRKGLKPLYPLHQLKHLANTYKSLGEVQFLRSQYTEAAENFKKSITTINKAIAQTGVLAEFYDVKGDSYLELGKTFMRLGEVDRAEKNFRRSIKTYEKAERYAREREETMLGKALALRYLGELKEGSGFYSESREYFLEAIKSIDHAMEITPGSIHVLYDRANALISLAGIQSRFSRTGIEALETYREAAKIFNQLTSDAPAFIAAYDGHANALSLLGQLQAWQKDFRGAVESYKQAIEVYDKALTIAPDYIQGLNNKGRALSALGIWLWMLDQPELAVSSLKQAEATFSKSLELAPEDRRIQGEKEMAYNTLVVVESGMMKIYNPEGFMDIANILNDIFTKQADEES